MNDRVLGLLGLARRAGKLTAGFDAVSDQIKDKTAALIILAADTSPKTMKNITFLGDRFHVKAVQVGSTMGEIGKAIGTRGKAGVLAVTDDGFAKKLIMLLETD